MKLLKVITILSSLFLLVNCSSTVQTVKETQGSFLNLPEPISLGEHKIADPGRYLWNQMQYLRFSLNNDEKKLHQSAVYHALNNIENGATTEWHNQERLARGKVRIVHSFPTSAGYCRVYQALIEVNGASRHQTNKACKQGMSNWIFLN